MITLSKGNEILYQSVHQEEDLSDENFIDAYVAYSKSGKAEGKLVYVNYGSKADFELLANTSIENPYYTDVKDKICISRYGQVRFHDFRFDFGFMISSIQRYLEGIKFKMPK